MVQWLRRNRGETVRYGNRSENLEVGASLVIGVDYPEPATQRATLTIRMPSTLAVRVQPSRGKLDISDVKTVELVEARGQVIVRESTDG